MKSHQKMYFFFMSLLIAALISTIVFFLAYTIACVVSPPYFIGEQGQKYATMPIGQAMLAGLISTILGIISLILLYRRITKSKING